MIALFVQFSIRASDLGSQTNAPARGSYESFRIISQRNIFNPNRSARPSQSGNETARPARTESFTLVGTMLYDDRQFAFFDSASSDYKKVLKSTDSIAGYKIAEVTPAGVKLELEGKTIEVAVGQQLTRQSAGEWKVTGKPAGESSASSSTNEKSTASSAEDDDVLKRLLKKREEELNK